LLEHFFIITGGFEKTDARAEQADRLRAAVVRFRQQRLVGFAGGMGADAFPRRSREVGEFHFDERLVNRAVLGLGAQFLLQLRDELVQFPPTGFQRRQVVGESAFVAQAFADPIRFDGPVVQSTAELIKFVPPLAVAAHQIGRKRPLIEHRGDRPIRRPLIAERGADGRGQTLFHKGR